MFDLLYSYIFQVVSESKIGALYCNKAWFVLLSTESLKMERITMADLWGGRFTKDTDNHAHSGQHCRHGHDLEASEQ